jgi:hypothetical protein
VTSSAKLTEAATMFADYIKGETLAAELLTADLSTAKLLTAELLSVADVEAVTLKADGDELQLYVSIAG